MRWTSPLGIEHVVRPIRPDDKARLSASLARLSRETIRRRFLAAKPRLTSTELRYLTEVDGHDHVALVVVDDDADIVAVGRFVRLGGRDECDTAEMAIVVGDHLQGQGLGTFLARRLADAALAEGITRFAATTLDENEAARRVMRTITDHLASKHAVGGVSELVGVLAPA